MSHLGLATLHLANTCPVVRIKDAMSCGVRWIWIGVCDRTISGRSFARQVADHLAGNDGLHSSSDLLVGNFRWSQVVKVRPNLPKVMGPQHLASNSAIGNALYGCAVLRREGPSSASPWRNIPDVFISKRPGKGKLCSELTNCELSAFFKEWYWFDHAASLITLDFAVKHD